MRRTLITAAAAIVLSAAPALAQSPTTSITQQSAPTQEQLIRAQAEGQAAAMNVGTGGWFGGGLASGVLLGLIGTGVTWAVAGSSNVQLPPEQRLRVASESMPVQQSFERAYADQVRSKRKSSALKGGLVGTAALVVLVLSASSSAQ